MNEIVIVIPALDAEPWLDAVVRGATAHGHPVVVVDDGSTDATSRVAGDAGAIVLRHDVNLGKGAALKTGFRRALELGAKAVVTLDADGQHLADQIPLFVQRWRSMPVDLLIGSRRHLFAGMLPRRRNANTFSAWAISRAAGVAIADSQSGFRLYSERLLREVELEGKGFDAESEVIVRAARRGFVVDSIPIELGFVNGVSTSHYRAVADTLKIAWRVTTTLLGQRGEWRSDRA